MINVESLKFFLFFIDEFTHFHRTTKIFYSASAETRSEGSLKQSVTFLGVKISPAELKR